MEEVLGTLAMFMEHNRRNSESPHEDTKALKSVVDKVGRFEGKNIFSFLRAYACDLYDRTKYISSQIPLVLH